MDIAPTLGEDKNLKNFENGAGGFFDCVSRESGVCFHTLCSGSRKDGIYHIGPGGHHKRKDMVDGEMGGNRKKKQGWGE